MKNSTRRLLGGLAVLCAASAFASPTLAETLQEKAALIPAAAFAQLPAMDNVQLSPGGSYMAYETAHDGRTYTVLMNRASGDKKALPPISEANIEWYRWVNDTGVLIAYGFENQRNYIRGKISETRLAYYDVSKDKFSWTVKHGGNKYANSRLRGDVEVAQFQDRIIDFLPDKPYEVLQAIDSNLDGDYEVRRLNVKTGSYSEVYPGTRGIQFWMTDTAHDIRYGWGVAETIGREYRYRKSDGTFVNAADLEWHKKGFRPLAFTDDPAVAYVTGPAKTGTYGLFKMNLDTGEIIEETFVHDKVDIDGIVYTGADGISGLSASGKPIAVAYTLDHPELHYFDERSAKIQKVVDKFLPGTRNRIVSQVPSKLQFVILARSEKDAGIFYILDLKQKTLDALAERMPGLTPDYMARPTPAPVTARDGKEIPGYLTLPLESAGKNLPTVMLVHGGPHSRDDMSYNPLVQFLASRGYAVYQPNFRGSDGYGPAYEAAGFKQWGGLMQDDVTDAAKWLLDSGVADPNRFCVMGGSYGGYAAAMADISSPGIFTCAVSYNGVMDLPGIISNDQYGYVGGKALVQHMGLEGAKPDQVSPIHNAEKITIPMFLVAAEDDAVVDASQTKRMHDKLQSLGKTSRLMMLPEGGHSLDTAPARTVFYERLERFLEKHLNTQVAGN